MKRLLTLALAAFLVAGGLYAQPDSSVGVPADKTMLIVRLPADATLTIGSQPTTLRGPERTFLTPALQAGNRYAYTVEARWLEGGREKRIVRRVEFQPGDANVIDLTQAASVTADEKPQAPPTQKRPKVRTFLFTYAGKLKDLPPGKEARVWLPKPLPNQYQQIEVVKEELPGKAEVGQDKTYGNTILSFTGKTDAKGELPFKVVYKVTRNEVKAVNGGTLAVKPSADEKVQRFLEPDAKVPTSGKPLDLLRERLEGQELPGEPVSAAKKLYDVVNDHMKYSKEGKGWGLGDAVWACDSRFGNCTDFHSLFISMARGNKIPAKFEMGFPIPEKRGEGPVGGYHCWAWFLSKNGWVPVDISEANRHPNLTEYYFGNLTEDRVQFTTGRDIDLVPPQKGPPLNYLIYPYAEVDGQAVPAEKMERAFAYQDLQK